MERLVFQTTHTEAEVDKLTYMKQNKVKGFFMVASLKKKPHHSGMKHAAFLRQAWLLCAVQLSM